MDKIACKATELEEEKVMRRVMRREGMGILLGFISAVVAGCALAGAPTAEQLQHSALKWSEKLSDKDAVIRKNAVQELMKLGTHAQKPLEKLVNSDFEELRESARNLLRRLLIEKQGLKSVDLKTLKIYNPNPDNKNAAKPSLRFNREKRVIAVKGKICLDFGPLEFLICSKGPDPRLHETILYGDVKPMSLSMVILACEYTFADELAPGKAIVLDDNAGMSISVQFEWKAPGTEKSKTVRLPLESLIWNGQTGKPMKKAPFVFTGSRTVRDEQSKRNIFMADVECLIAGLKFSPDAIINSPLDTNQFDPDSQECYEVDERYIPKSGTECWIVFEPYTGPKFGKADFKDSGDKNKGKNRGNNTRQQRKRVGQEEEKQEDKAKEEPKETPEKEKTPPAEKKE